MLVMVTMLTNQKVEVPDCDKKSVAGYYLDGSNEVIDGDEGGIVDNDDLVWYDSV